MSEMRKIIHVDMDSFFASVEQHDNPDLRGKPIAVGFDGPRGVVSTASYEARRWGVHSAQPIATAKRLCPILIIVDVHFDRYREVSHQIHEIFHDYTDLIEPISLDEAFLDVTHNKVGEPLAVNIAKEIKQRIYETTGLTASAGVSYNKLLAKIASDYRKPNGLCTVHPDRALDFIAALPVEDLWGVGPKTAEHMHMMGVRTVRQLRELSDNRLRQEFGKMGAVFYDFARAIDDRPVVCEYERKSVGTERTLLKDIWHDEDVLQQIDELADELVVRLNHDEFEGRTLTLKLKFGDFTQITRSITKEDISIDRDSIVRLSRQLLAQVDYDRDHPVRLLGLSMSNPRPSIEETVRQWVKLELKFKPWPDEEV